MLKLLENEFYLFLRRYLPRYLPPLVSKQKNILKGDFFGFELTNFKVVKV